MDYSPNSPAAYEQQEIIEHKLAGTFGAFLFARPAASSTFCCISWGTWPR